MKKLHRGEGEQLYTEKNIKSKKIQHKSKNIILLKIIKNYLLIFKSFAKNVK